MLEKVHRNLELDRVRTMGMLGVISYHFYRNFYPWHVTLMYEKTGTVLNIFENCWSVLDLFFVISGFIISKMVVEKIDACSQDPVLLTQYLRQYFIRRFFRVYPVAGFFFFLVLFLSVFFNSSGMFSTLANNVEAGFSVLTLSFGYYIGAGYYHSFALGPYWTLSIEELFYISLPFFLIFIKSEKARVWSMLTFLLVSTFIIRPFTPNNMFYTHIRFDGIVYGCLLYLLSRKRFFSEIYISDGQTRFFQILFVIVVFLTLAAIPALNFSISVIVPLGCILSFLLVGMAALEAGLVSFGKWANMIVDYLGARSYSFYISHFPCLVFINEVFFRLSKTHHWVLDNHFKLPYTISGILLVLIVAECSYRFLERPGIAYGRSFMKPILREKKSERLEALAPTL